MSSRRCFVRSHRAMPGRLPGPLRSPCSRPASRPRPLERTPRGARASQSSANPRRPAASPKYFATRLLRRPTGAHRPRSRRERVSPNCFARLLVPRSRNGKRRRRHLPRQRRLRPLLRAKAASRRSSALLERPRHPHQPPLLPSRRACNWAGVRGRCIRPQRHSQTRRAATSLG